MRRQVDPEPVSYDTTARAPGDVSIPRFQCQFRPPRLFTQKSGQPIGKWSDGTEGPDVPAAVIVAYMMSNGSGWQRVEHKAKGKRGRSS